MIIHNLTFLKKTSEIYDSIAIIGKGKNADKYTLDKDKIFILTINGSFLNYKNYSHCTCIVEGHLNRNLPLTMDDIENGIIIKRKDIKENNLVTGCTPSIVISYIIRYTNFKNIFLQGFSMDGAIVLNDPTITKKIQEIYKNSIELYIENNNIEESYKYFQYHTHEFVGQINHYPYEWDRQVAAFEECFKLSEKYKKNLCFITPCTRNNKFFKFQEIDKEYLK